ncbi:MAG: type VI secretion system tip protein VgrG [Proteobacteria bacterium]|nr:type VI secretion system tip protein VgrG [Pseudomonadota bacterium]
MQKASYLTLSSTLDKTVKRSHKFNVQSVKGTEKLCDDFSFMIKVNTLEKITQKELQELIGDSVTVQFAFKDRKFQEGCRYLNGVVYQVKELGMSKAPHLPDIWRYEIEIGSWMRSLGLVSDCRIFQKSGNNGVKIVTELLKELGFTDIQNKTSGKFARKDYAVIYNEPLLNFIKRLLFDDGVTWFFDHTEKRHTLVLVDDTSKFTDLPVRLWGDGDHIKRFFRETSHTPVSSWQVSAYDWENPPVKCIQKRVGEKKAELNHFHFPGEFIQRNEGEILADRNKTAIKSHKTCYRGESNSRILAAGCVFQLHADTLPELHQQPFLIKSLHIEATSEQYKNSFEVYRAKEPYFSDQTDFQRPEIYGSQTATVVGEAGTGKINTDKMGRVKVRFHWDHHNPSSSSSTSAFIRVAGPCAGAQRGFVFTPRIGEEVTVSYENGNPDKPLITGSVYSNDRKPPKAASSKPYKSYIKTGSESDANYITFNDTPGSENFEINAKKDFNIVVGRDLDIEVEDDITLQVKKVNIIIRKDIKVQAGGSIINLTLKNANNTAGSNINNMALGGIINVAGGVVTNLAGCTLTNTAIFSVENTSAAAINGKAATLFANTALNAVGSSGPKVENDAGLAMTNISKGGILNDAKGVKTETLFQKVKVKENSITETGKFNIKGLMSKIN